jgi:hypothetical protein
VTSFLTKQFRFTLALADLVHKAKQLGYKPKLVYVYRDPEWQKVLVARGASRTLNSRHCINLAGDLYLFTQNDKLIEDYETYKVLGDWWEKLGEDFVWGGDWDRNDATQHSLVDSVHFEVKP